MKFNAINGVSTAGKYAAIACALSACAAGVPPNPSTAPAITISYARERGDAMTSADPIVLFDQQSLAPFNAALYLEAQPVVGGTTAIQTSWTSNSTSVLVEKQRPFTVPVAGSAIPTAPPNATYIQVGQTYGPAVITVNVTAPFGGSASIVAYHYRSLSFGCYFRSDPAIDFVGDTAIALHDKTQWLTADLFETAPSDSLGPLDPCQNSTLATLAGTSVIWHVPLGGTIVPGRTLQQFVSVKSSQWKDDGTAFTVTTPTIMVFKTNEGSIVKALLPIGPYEVTR